jgi:hypothetical protein
MMHAQLDDRAQMRQVSTRDKLGSAADSQQPEDSSSTRLVRIDDTRLQIVFSSSNHPMNTMPQLNSRYRGSGMRQCPLAYLLTHVYRINATQETRTASKVVLTATTVLDTGSLWSTPDHLLGNVFDRAFH